MASIEERLKLKRGQVDTWSTKEKLCLASCVLKCGNQNWMSVSRNLKVFAGEPGRPPDWFSQKSCAVQYDCLLDRVETPKRKKRGADGTKSEGSDISPGESIVKQLVAERIEEVKKLMAEVKATYLRNKEELQIVESGRADDRLNEFTLQIQEEKRQKEREQEAHQKWLKEREERKQEMEYAWRPFASPHAPHGRAAASTPGAQPGAQAAAQVAAQAATPGSQNQVEAGRRPRNQSEISEPDSNLESPLSVEIGSEEAVEINTAPTPTSPLLTSLLKSPSQAQSSSILHSAITSQRGASPTITSLLNSSPSIPNNSGSASPNIKALVSTALASRAEEGQKAVCHTASGSPTLSMLLELPPSVPGQPLPELPSNTATPPGAASAAASTPVTGAPVYTVAAEAVPGTTTETPTVSQPGDAKTDALPDISAMDIMMPVDTEANIAEAERGLNIETADLQHLSHADLELVMDPMDMVLEEGDISLVEEMAVLIEVSSDGVGSSVNSVLDMNSKDAMAVAAEAQKLQAEAEQIQAAASTPVPVMPGGIPQVVLPEASLADITQVTSPPAQAAPSPQQTTPVSAAKEAGTPKKSRPVARKIDLEVACEEAVVTAPLEEPKQEPVDDLSELSEIVEQVDSYVEPKPEDVMRTVGLSKEALENASIVIIEDDGDVVKMPDEIEEKVEETVVSEELELKDVVEAVSTQETGDLPVVPTVVPDEVVEETVTIEEIVEESIPLESDDAKPARILKQRRNSRDEEKKEDGRRNSLRKSERKEERRNLAEEPVKEEAVPIEPDAFLDANEESQQTLDKIHLLVEEEARKNEAKDDFDNISEERESFEETFTKEEVESVILEKRDESAEKVRKEEARTSRETPKGSRPRRNSRREKSPDLVESSNEAIEEVVEKKETSRKERKTSSSQESDKSDGRRSETALLRRDERRKEEDSKVEDDQDKSTIGKVPDLAEVADDSSRPGDSDKESSLKYDKSNRSETPSTEDDKTSDVELQSTRSASSRRARSGRDYSDSVPSSPASTQAVTDEEKDYRAWKKSIMLVYGRIAAHKSASLFLRPITDDKAPGYSQMIYRPMDLFTMKKNIENGVIRTTAEFQRDVLLMFNNAIMYNKSGSHVHEMASAMQEEGVQILKEFVNTQLLVQAAGSDVPNVPSRRGTRTTEKRDLDGDRASTPKAGSSAGSSTNTPGSSQLPAGKRKRSIVPEEARTLSKRRKAEDL